MERPAPIHESRFRLGDLLKTKRSAGRWWSSDKADWNETIPSFAEFFYSWVAHPMGVNSTTRMHSDVMLHDANFRLLAGTLYVRC